MATPVTASFKVDPKLKQEAQELFSSMELTFSAAVNLFLRQCVREQAIPFRIGSPSYNEETLRAVQESRQGINMLGPYRTVDDAWKVLESANEED